MHKYIPYSLFALLVVVAMTGCNSLKMADTTAVQDAPALMSYLGDQGVFYMSQGAAAMPQFSVPAQEFTVAGGGTLQVLEYNSGAGSLLDLEWMDDDMNGHAAPHLYRSERMIVIYYGNDPKVQNVLSDAFGVPVA